MGFRGRPVLIALARIAAAIGAVAIIAVAAIWVLQERLVFLPPPVPSQQGRGAERVAYVAADGQQLFGFLVGDTAANGAPFVIAFHGNGDLADSWIDWARDVAAAEKCRVLLAEYRGYGGLAGRTTYAGVMLDARAAVAFAKRRFGVDERDVVLYGHSLGSGVATQLATEIDARAVLLEAPLTSVVEVGQRNFRAPISWLLPFVSRIDFAPLQRVRVIRAPVSVAVGARDDVLPPSMGRRVYQSARRRGGFLEVLDAGHSDVASLGGDRYWAWLRAAITDTAAKR